LSDLILSDNDDVSGYKHIRKFSPFCFYSYGCVCTHSVDDLLWLPFLIYYFLLLLDGYVNAEFIFFGGGFMVCSFQHPANRR